jgi:aminoglycoside phosphotransferase (APT) family kinase protein
VTVARTGAATGDEFEDALSRALAGRLRDRRIVAVTRSPSAYRTSAAIEDLHLALDEGSTLELVFKDAGESALSAVALRAKPAVLRDPLREIRVYETILQRLDLGTATCYGTVVDADRGRFWLFLERVVGVELYQVGELDGWKDAARWLARMHAVAPSRLPPDDLPLVSYDGPFYRMWAARAREFAPPASASAVDSLAKRYETVVERLLELPRTVLHGEFYASNILVAGTGAGIRVCPVDWEMAALGPGLVDLAALISGRWDEQQRLQLAYAYHRALDPSRAPPLQAFLEALAHCRLHIAMQWLGWARDWSPPPEHANDWLGDALALADELRL